MAGRLLLLLRAPHPLCILPYLHCIFRVSICYSIWHIYFFGRYFCSYMWTTAGNFYLVGKRGKAIQGWSYW